MKKEDFSALLSDIRAEYIHSAAVYRPRSAFLLRIGMAACLCLLAVIALPLMIPSPPQTPPDPPAGDVEEVAPCIHHDGKTYYVSPYLEMSREIPDGFVYAGTTSIDGTGDYAYYTHPDHPEWIYVEMVMQYDGSSDDHGALLETEPHIEYVRYVESNIRGRNFICLNNILYESMWTLSPSESEQLYTRAEETYGIRIEGDVPDGFICVGTAEFSGHDTIPTGALASNTGKEVIYTHLEDSDILLVSTKWHTAPDSTGEILHCGFNVYIRRS